MKLTKKQSLKFAVYEYEQRTGDWESLPDEPDWTVEDQVTQDGGLESYMKHPESSIATMMFDGYFRDFTKKDFAWARRFYGAKLWQAALEAYCSGDHDT